MFPASEVSSPACPLIRKSRRRPLYTKRESDGPWLKRQPALRSARWFRAIRSPLRPCHTARANQALAANEGLSSMRLVTKAS